MDKILSSIETINKAASKIPKFGGVPDLEPPMPKRKPIDRRSRSEVREDFEKELESLDKSALVDIKERLIKLQKFSNNDVEELWLCKEELQNVLVKFVRYIDEFEDLNSDESRKVALKEKELKLDGRNDWNEKSRMFFFRVLASALFVTTLFTIGYIEKEYDWATLPLSKYVKPIPQAILK